MKYRLFVRTHQAGVSLIEALIAMAVMAFGMLALLGLQGTLRGNFDISKQRAEAVRMAHEKLEELRGFSVLGTGAKSYALILQDATATDSGLAGYASSAQFSRKVDVTEYPTGTTSDLDLYYIAFSKQVAATVTWSDRNNEAQVVKLSTIVGKIAPEVAGALSVTATNAPQQTPGGRHRAIPPGAVNMPGDPSKSVFNPAATTGVYWKFDNKTGYVVGVCPDMSGAGCVAVDKRLLWGHVRYSLGTVLPTSQQSETPTDFALPTPLRIGVVVHQPAYPQAVVETQGSPPLSGPTICLIDPNASSFGAYYCLMSFDVPDPQTIPPTVGVNWSGRSTITINGCWDNTNHNDPVLLTGQMASPYRCEAADAALIAASPTDFSSAHFRICRYTSQRGQIAVGAGTPPLRNIDHPLDYLSVTESLNNQNFLVIRAGDDFSAFPCPDDNPVTPLTGTTYAHQPTTQVPPP